MNGRMVEGGIIDKSTVYTCGAEGRDYHLYKKHHIHEKVNVIHQRQTYPQEIGRSLINMLGSALLYRKV